MTDTVNRADLEAKVKEVYRSVALHPRGKYHFRMGRELAVELGSRNTSRMPTPAQPKPFNEE